MPATVALFLALQSQSSKTSDDPSVGVAIIVGLIIVFAVYMAKQKTKTLKAARDKYYRAIDELKADPTNPNQRQRTLELGRIYSNLTRQKKGVTIFDEIALMNDINAACAGAMLIANAPPKTTVQQSIEGRLARRSELKTKGLIDEQEYAARRERILDEV